MKNFIFLLCLVVRAYADIEAGIVAYNKGDYPAAQREFAVAAKANDPMGIHLLASLYYEGKGVEKDLKQAVILFTAAAEKGLRASQANLGLMYHHGDGVGRDVQKAISYYTAAAKQGDLQSSFNLGQIFREAEGVDKDYSKAAACYKFAAERGYASAANEYGLMFAQGQGVALDYVEAFGWISFAAKAGDGQANKNFAQLKQILAADLHKGEKRAEEIEK